MFKTWKGWKSWLDFVVFPKILDALEFIVSALATVIGLVIGSLPIVLLILAIWALAKYVGLL